jgi:FSR family fosmidomycin resistance protein-like MFS transporter
VRAAPAPEPSPDTEGRTRDLTLLSAAHGVTHIPPALYPLIFPYAMRDLGFGYAQIGLFVGVIGVIWGLLQGIHGWVSRYVRRTTLCAGGNVLLGVSLLVSGFAGNFSSLLGLRLAGAIASSPQHPIGSSLLADWFQRKRRATAFAIHITGGSVGTVITPILAGLLLPRVGWRETLVLAGIPGVVVGALLWWLVRDEAASQRREAAATRHRHAPQRGLFRDPNVRALLLVRVLTSGGRGLGVLLTYVPLYLVAVLHVPAAAVGFYVAVLAAGSVVTPVVSGHLADLVGRRKPVMLVSLWISAASVALFVASGANRLGILGALIALSLTVYNEGSLSQALLADIVPDTMRDGAFSLFYVISFTSGALWALAFGLVIARWHFTPAFVAMIASYLAATIALVFVREGRGLGAPHTAAAS